MLTNRPLVGPMRAHRGEAARGPRRSGPVVRWQSGVAIGTDDTLSSRAAGGLAAGEVGRARLLRRAAREAEVGRLAVRVRNHALAAAERYSTGPLRTPSAPRRFFISASCVTIAAALAVPRFTLVPCRLERGAASPACRRGADRPRAGARFVVALSTQRASWRSVRLLRFGTLTALPWFRWLRLGALLLFFQGPVLVVISERWSRSWSPADDAVNGSEPGSFALFVVALLIFPPWVCACLAQPASGR